MFLTNDTKYSIDNFKISTNKYFLTHFHADHYGGLTSKFVSIIYCSQTTANLAKKTFRIPEKHFKILELYEWHEIESMNYVMMIDANHCPGAGCFVFSLNKIFYFHCGDFRCSSEFYSQFKNNQKKEFEIVGLKRFLFPLKEKILETQYEEPITGKINEIHLIENVVDCQIKLPNYKHIMDLVYDSVFIDNTYEGFKDFETQSEAIFKLLRFIEKKLCDKNHLIKPKICFLFATYCIGKEKIFLSVAEYFNYTIYANKYKMDRLNCICESSRASLHFEIQNILENYGKPYKKSSNVFNRLTNNIESENQIRLVSMANIKTKLTEMTKDLEYDRVCLFVGTGWHNKIVYKTFVKESGRVIRSGIEIIYFPYSEHSSSEELLDFKKKIKAYKIINTVKNKHKIEHNEDFKTKK